MRYRCLKRWLPASNEKRNQRRPTSTSNGPKAGMAWSGNPPTTPLNVGDAASDSSVLDEARLEIGPSDPLYRLALLRHVAQGGNLPSDWTEANSSQADDGISRARRPVSPTPISMSWLERQHLDPAGLDRLLLDEAIDRGVSGRAWRNVLGPISWIS